MVVKILDYSSLSVLDLFNPLVFAFPLQLSAYLSILQCNVICLFVKLTFLDPEKW